MVYQIVNAFFLSYAKITTNDSALLKQILLPVQNFTINFQKRFYRCRGKNTCIRKRETFLVVHALHELSINSTCSHSTCTKDRR